MRFKIQDYILRKKENQLNMEISFLTNRVIPQRRR